MDWEKVAAGLYAEADSQLRDALKYNSAQGITVSLILRRLARALEKGLIKK